MKRLYLLRHAKASPAENLSSDDRARPLSKAGVGQCFKVAEYLKENDINLDLILSSDSKRTTETTEQVLITYGKEVRVNYSPDLYLASDRSILNAIHSLDGRSDNVMIVGHNPGVHQVAFSLVVDGDENMIGNLSTNFPTASLAVIDFAVDDWSEVKLRSGALIDFIITKKS